MYQTHEYIQAMRVVNANRPRCAEFWRDLNYDGLELSLLLDTDENGLHLREIWAAGNEIDWFPKHICGLIKAQVVAEIEGERA